MPAVSMRNFVAVAPRGTAAARRSGRFGWEQTTRGIDEAETRIFHCLTGAADRFHIHSERVFLVGWGSGGTMALRVAWNNPQQFAGAASLGGPAPTEQCPLRRVNDLRRLPLLIATSRQSRKYPEQHVCRDLRLLHAAGCTVALRQYPGKDELTTGVLGDLNRWLMERVCNAT
jgi:phospholipase/carboxylesterase